MTWDDVLTAALVGTERRDPGAPLAPDGTPLGAGGTAEERLLLAATVWTGWRAAGHAPDADAPATEPAPPDELCPPPVRACQVLDLLLDSPTVFSEAEPLVRTWLEACGRAGFRLPHPYLDPLLERGTYWPSLRPALRPVLDHRGRWLAARYDRWRWAAGDAGTPVDWKTATRNQRVDDLRARRASDPDAARALLEEHLTGTPAGERADLVAALEVGLGDGDEPLLERLLDDRAKGVRVAAARLLDRLPRSARAARLGEALRSLVAVGDRGRAVEVDLPGDDHAVPLTRDVPDGGVAAVTEAIGLTGTAAGRPAPSGPTVKPALVKGKRAQLLVGIVAGAPLSTWTDADARPDAVAALAAERHDVLYGLLGAILGRHDREWGEAVFARLPLAALVPVLDGPTVDAGIAKQLARTGDHDLDRVLDLADALTDDWSIALSRATVKRLRGAPPPVVTRQERRLARRLHTDVSPDVERWIRDLDGADAPYAQRAVRRLLQSLTIRRTIAEEFA